MKGEDLERIGFTKEGYVDKDKGSSVIHTFYRYNKYPMVLITKSDIECDGDYTVYFFENRNIFFRDLDHLSSFLSLFKAAVR